MTKRASRNTAVDLILEADMALAYNELVRLIGWEVHYVKINFAMEQDYGCEGERVGGESA